MLWRHDLERCNLRARCIEDLILLVADVIEDVGRGIDLIVDILRILGKQHEVEVSIEIEIEKLPIGTEIFVINAFDRQDIFGRGQRIKPIISALTEV